MTKYWPVYAAATIFIAAAFVILGPTDSSDAKSTAKGESGMVEYRISTPGIAGVQIETFYWADDGKLQATRTQQASGGKIKNVGFILARNEIYFIDYDANQAIKSAGGSDRLRARAAANAAMIATNPRVPKSVKLGVASVAGVACEIYAMGEQVESCMVDDVPQRQIVKMKNGRYEKIAVRAVMDGQIDPAIFAPPPGMTITSYPQ